MKTLICKCAKAGDFNIEMLEVMLDHVHLLISFKPKYAPTDIVKYIKGYTAREFFKVHPDTRKQDFWGGHLWSNSYFMSTLGNMSKDVVKQYIENQYVKAENKSANSSRG
jgi:putative transposase